ncbi:hypothetical protein [Microlunatus sp. Gsoil 973]|nr:hypothetical protein [Microlunatus sp. Gsoil 973]QGN34070.1 hypothetical protein GJV80_15990 [Microlunatus sp. Gsoil 973]
MQPCVEKLITVEFSRLRGPASTTASARNLHRQYQDHLAVRSGAST